MASEALKKRIANVDKHAEKDPLDPKLLEAYVIATEVAINTEKDVEYGLLVGQKAKDYLNNLIFMKSQGGNFKWLEELSQKTGEKYPIIDAYYDILKLEAPYLLDSFKLYIEKNRPRKERFYEPRRDTLYRITDAVQRLENDELDMLFLHQPPRTGKLLADDTPVFTSKGWKNHGNLVIGDKVIGSDGNFTEVKHVFDKDVANYRVTLSNGEELYCHGNHEWTVWNRSAQRWHTYETHEMIDKLKRPDIKRGKRVERNNIYLPYREPMSGIEKCFDLHPYVLGAWLGDGTNTKPWITDPIEDLAVIEKIMMCGYPLRKVYTHKTTGVKSYVLDSKLKDDLHKYDMCFYEKTCEKHIPTEYLTASLEQRLELLAGLLDTDGTLVKKERRYKFSTVSERLKDDFVTLIHTFGWRTCVTIEKPHASSFGIEGKQDCYIISFNPTLEIPCVLERKKLKEFSNLHRIAIEKIEHCDEIQGNCIQVSNADGLYAVGKTMQLTHNSGDLTMDVTWHCSRDTEHSNLYITYKEGLGGAFLQGVTEILTDPTYCYGDVFPDVKIADTDAKNNKLDLGRKKKYKSLSGKGLESGLNGEYDAYGWMILDDVLEGVQDVLSEDVLKRKQTIFDNNVLSRKKEKCKLILMGTLWSTHDLFCNYLDFVESSPEMADTRYEVIKIPALDPDTDESNFNYEYGVGFTTKYYRSVRAKFENNDDMVGWQCQYMQQPIEREGAVFNPEHMNYYSELPGIEPVKVIAHCDVALGGADYLAFPIAYYFDTPNGLVGYVDDVVYDNSEKHITQPQVLSKIKKHGITQVHVESNQGGEGYKDDIIRMLKEDTEYKKVCNITSDWAMTTMRKDQRIWDNAQDIRNLYFRDPNHRDLQYRKFMQNLFSFTMGKNKHKHDDAADALAGLVQFEREGSGVTTAVIMKSPI